MATYFLDIIPPQPTKLGNGSVTDDQLRQSPQNYFNGSDIIWVTVAGALVLQMIPGIAMVYSGATDRSSTITQLRMPIITAAFCTVQWYLWGYVLTFAPAEDPTKWTWYGGNTDSMLLYRALIRPVGAKGPKIPELLYAFYQGMFASFTPALICGGVIKKFRVGRFLIFILLWSLLVYYPVARWTWSVGGFSEQNNVMDFAGGTAVHITSGTAVGAVVLFHELERHKYGIFKRAWEVIRTPQDTPEIRAEDVLQLQTIGQVGQHQAPGSGYQPGGPSNAPNGLPTTQTAPAVNIHGTSVAPRPTVRSDEVAYSGRTLGDDAPHSIHNLVLGTMMLWIGWLGFNGGSALGGNMRAVAACAATNVAASSGPCVMLLLFWLQGWAAKHRKDLFSESEGPRISVVHFCDGAVVGLIAVTPAAGFVPVWGALCIGTIASVVIFGLKNTVLENLMRQDPLFVFLFHTGGGLIGMFLTGCFARQYIVGFDGYSSIPDRTVSERLRWQMADAFMGFGFTLGMTLAILLIMKIVLRLVAGKGTRLLEDDARDKLEGSLEWKKRDD